MLQVMFLLNLFLLVFGSSAIAERPRTGEIHIEKPDTNRLNQLVFEGRRREASAYLYEFLHSQANPINSDLSQLWLRLAILQAWTDDIHNSQQASDNHHKSSEGNFLSLSIRSDRLLLNSLYLLKEESNNQAIDSLIASVNIRPAQGTMNQLLGTDSYGLLARLCKRTGDLHESARYFQKSIESNRILKRTLVLADDLTDYSSVITAMNTTDTMADSALHESLKIFTLSGDWLNVATVFNELGVLHNRRGSLRQSLDFFLESLRVKQGIPGISRQEFAVVNNNIGHCYQLLGKSDSARTYFTRAVKYAVESGRNPASYFANLGANYGRQEEFTLALGFFQKALASLDPGVSPTDITSNTRTAKAIPQLADFTAFKAHTLRQKYLQQKDPKDLILALNTFMIALEMMDTLRFLYSFESKPFLSSEAKIHYFNALEMALEAYSLTSDENYLNMAFKLAGRNKSATLDEFIRTNQARTYLANVSPWMHKEDSIKQLINRTESHLINMEQSQFGHADSILALKSRISSLTDDLRSISRAAQKENPGYLSMIYSNQGYSPADIQPLLMEGEALIDYTVGRDLRRSSDHMVIFVLTRDTILFIRQVLPSTLRKTIDEFRRTITPYVDTGIFNEFCRISYILYNQFVKPISVLGSLNRLVILPDQELGFLPFETFITDTLKPRSSDFRRLNYLNRKYQISYISSHQQFYLQRLYASLKEPAIIFSFAPFHKEGAKIDTLDLVALANSGEELKEIAKLFKTRIFWDKQAGEESLRKALMLNSVINISSHGIIDPEHPLRSRLFLNPAEPDGSLYLFEMMSLKINSPLVILNACNTGTGQLQVGEGILSMARGFQLAGVSSVITTLWPVDDQSSGKIIGSFFKNMHGGMDQREALMTAKNRFIAEATMAGSAPYFWAGQILIGDTQKINIANRKDPLLTFILVGLGALILALIGILYKKVR